MTQEIRIGEDQVVTLEFGLIEDVINVDDLTIIDTSNLFGEAVTISAAANRVGLMKADVDSKLAGLKLDLKLYENGFRNSLRAEASKNNGSYSIVVKGEKVTIKLTETGLATCHDSDPEWLRLKREVIAMEKSSNSLDALYWAVQDKGKKLNGLVASTTPEEFIAGVVEGKINGIMLSKGQKKKAASLG
jgi:hypothetical protein